MHFIDMKVESAELFPGLLNKPIFVLSELIVKLLKEQYSCSLDKNLCKPSAV